MITHEEWQDIARSFQKAAPSSPAWFAHVDAIITYLIQEKLEETREGREGE